jgi:hypothetical protein
VRKLILGVSGFGKSHLAHAIAESYQDQDVNVLVCDPHGERWPADYQTTDPFKLLALAKRSKRCAIFLEEAGECIGRGKQAREMQWFTTGSRKWGHSIYLIAQRATMIELSIRAQCTAAYVFRQCRDDAEELARQFAEPELERAATLPKYQFLYIESGSKPRLMQLR